MELTFDPLRAPIGARVYGLDPSKLGESTTTSQDLVGQLAQGLARHSVLVFKDLDISAAEFVGLGRLFGKLEILPEPDKRHGVHPEIFNLTNVRPDGRIVEYDEAQAVFLRGTQRWHTDSSFREIPCLCTMLYALQVPSQGGQTQFADMYAAHDALAPALKERFAALRLVHDYVYSRDNNPGEMDKMSEAEKAKYPAVSHPLVRTHGDGRRSLYMGGHVSHIEGLDIEAGREMVASILDQATQPRFVYEHTWDDGDLVIWDNRSTLHRLRPYDIASTRRVMQRITVSGTEPVT